MSEKALVLWSGGKESALALHEARRQLDVVALLTTITEPYDRISMHGVRTALLDCQARALGLAVEKVRIPSPCCNADYEARMSAAFAEFRRQGVTTVVCGAIFLEDVRRYREAQLAAAGLTGFFPLWGQDSRSLAEHFLALGFQAVLCCVDSQVLDASFAGRLYDESLLVDLPPGA